MILPTSDRLYIALGKEIGLYYQFHLILAKNWSNNFL